MNIITIILLILLFITLLWGVYERGNKKIHIFIHDVEGLLKQEYKPLNQRISEAKSLCRDTKGIVSFAIYSILNSIK